MSFRLGRALLALAGCLVVAACGEPPTKEMDMARQAIRVAHDARADVYAADELAAAEQAMDKSTAAVTGRDFKLALNHALTSHERAQAATRLAAEAEKALRGRLETTLEDATNRLTAARTRVDGAAKVRATKRVATQAGRTLSTIEGELQKAGALVSSGDLQAADARLEGVNGRIAAAIATLEPPKRPAPATKRPATRAR